MQEKTEQTPTALDNILRSLEDLVARGFDIKDRTKDLRHKLTNLEEEEEEDAESCVTGVGTLSTLTSFISRIEESQRETVKELERLEGLI